METLFDELGLFEAEKPIKKGNTRVTGKEQYYTPNSLALELMREMSKFVPDISSRHLLEPAGGTGAFIEAGKALGLRDFTSFDIEPHHDLVKEADFLAVRLERDDYITVTNPPFGRNNSLSIPFFNKVASHSTHIGFLVPRSWRKWSVINRLNRHFHLVSDTDISIDYVDTAGALISDRSTLKTCFQIWERRENERELVKVIDHGFIRKTTFDEADVSLTIFGYGCGTVKTEFPRKSNTTQMFLKLEHPLALEALKNVDFSQFFTRTAYTPALSLQEINYLLNDYILNK